MRVCVRARQKVRQATQSDSTAMTREGRPRAMEVITSGDIDKLLLEDISKELAKVND